MLVGEGDVLQDWQKTILAFESLDEMIHGMQSHQRMQWTAMMARGTCRGSRSYSTNRLRTTYRRSENRLSMRRSSECAWKLSIWGAAPRCDSNGRV